MSNVSAGNTVARAAAEDFQIIRTFCNSPKVAENYR